MPGIPFLKTLSTAAGTSPAIPLFRYHLVVYRGLDGVKFRGSVRPGDLCEITCSLLEQKGSLYVCKAALSVNEKRCAEAQITLAATPKV